MKKFLRNLIVLGFFAVGGYCLYRFFSRLKQTIKLDKSLPLFLKNTIGEEPSVQINLQFRSLAIILKLTAETIEREPDVEELVREYIADFYPALANMNLSVCVEKKDEGKELKLDPEDEEAEVDVETGIPEVETEETEA